MQGAGVACKPSHRDSAAHYEVQGIITTAGRQALVQTGWHRRILYEKRELLRLSLSTCYSYLKTLTHDVLWWMLEYAASPILAYTFPRQPTPRHFVFVRAVLGCKHPYVFLHNSTDSHERLSTAFDRALDSIQACSNEGGIYRAQICRP